MRLSHLLAAALLALPLPAFAQNSSHSGGPTAGQLMQQCLNGVSKGVVNDPACTGYIAGFVGALRIARTVSSDFPICLPAQSLPNMQILEDVSDYLAANPDKLNASARSIMFLVLTLKYPCDVQ